uniref:Fibronectin type-III domain-containing protein n=1 Tax=Eptatretus burgeri TaxID=7764 RepID=A0A8C4QH20_EPTBU
MLINELKILNSIQMLLRVMSGVSKIVTVDVRPEAARWLRVKDLVKGMTYQFQVKGRTFAYGPEAKANVSTAPMEGSPGPPATPRVIRHDSEVSLQWEEGKPSRSPMTSYMIEARPSDEGLWDILIKDLQKDQTSYTFSNTLLKPGISYTFRIVPVNSYGCGLPSEPSEPYSVFTDSAFYDEWWFLVVVALSGLILILLLVFILVIRGQSQKHLRRGNSGMTPKAGTLAHEEMVSLDDRFTASLELNERQLPVKNTFGRRSALQARSPPRPSPGSLRYTDEDLPAEYDSIKKPDSNGSLNEKLSEIPESPSEEEGDPDKIEERDTTHSFVNHYISDPTYYNSWRRQQRDLLRPKVQCSLEGERGEAEGANHVVKSPYASSDGDIRMAASFGPGLAGFSSFV